MKRLLIFILFFVAAPAVLAQENAVQTAAARFLPGTNWKANSVITGDFTCRGRQEFAILGTSKRHLVVAIFAETLKKPPEVLRFSATARDPTTSELTIEDGDFDLEEFQNVVGYIPDGMRPSKTCKGLNLSDGNVDSAHIYWNHDAKQFSDWVL